MAKGDDARLKKKNKAIRKKQRKDPSAVSVRVASIIAAKKRRQSGQRRQCQGMCFSLPTPDDPFNDRPAKKNITAKKDKKRMPVQTNNNVSVKDRGDSKRKTTSDSELVVTNKKEPKATKVTNLVNEETLSVSTEKTWQENHPNYRKGVGLGMLQKQVQGIQGRPSKFHVLCLKTIHDAFPGDDEHFIANTWGAEFWKCYSEGKDILETTGVRPTLQQIAWMASTAADSISRKENEGISITCPFLLYLVPSQEDAVKVRSVCKPLKSLGIHTVSLHSGASLDHQISGLMSCEPEFLVATPLRLWELVSMKAIDVSGVSLLILDGLDRLSESGCLDVVKHIIQLMLEYPRVVVFQGCSNSLPIETVGSVLKEPFYRLSVYGATKTQNTSSFQTIHPYTPDKEQEEP